MELELVKKTSPNPAKSLRFFGHMKLLNFRKQSFKEKSLEKERNKE